VLKGGPNHVHYIYFTSRTGSDLWIFYIYLFLTDVRIQHEQLVMCVFLSLKWQRCFPFKKCCWCILFPGPSINHDSDESVHFLSLPGRRNPFIYISFSTLCGVEEESWQCWPSPQFFFFFFPESRPRNAPWRNATENSLFHYYKEKKWLRFFRRLRSSSIQDGCRECLISSSTLAKGGGSRDTPLWRVPIGRLPLPLLVLLLFRWRSSSIRNFPGV